jgi:pilus assembly protein CpaC
MISTPKRIRMGNRLICFIFLTLISLQVFAQDEEPTKEERPKEIEVIVNLEKIIQLDFVPYGGLGGVKVGNENFATVTIVPAKKQINVIGLKAGETTLNVRDSVGDVRGKFILKVTANDQSKIIGQLKELLGDVEGLEIGYKGDFVYVGGQIVVPSDIGKVVVILDKPAYVEVLRLVELSPQTQLIIGRKMQDEMQKSGLKDVTVRVVNGSFWIEGVVNSEDESKKAEQVARAYLPDQIQNLARRTDSVQSTAKKLFENLLTINTKPKPAPLLKLFKITAQFVELTKGFDRLFAFTWTPTIGADGGQVSIGKSNSGGVTTSSSGTLAATISNLFPKLNSAKSAGHARVVESGVVVVKEKIAGVIKKQTSIPYQIGNTDNAKAGTAVSGFEMKVTPSMLEEEKINLVIGMSVNSTSGDNPPQTLSNSIETEIIVKSQESAVLGGVVTNKSQTDFDKDGEPVKAEGGSALFSFVKSKKYSTSRTQFVMFITPEIIETASSGASEIERKFRKRSR